MLHKCNINLEKRLSYLISMLGADYLKQPKDKLKVTSEEIHKYQSLIGSLMYLMLGTQPDIAYAIGRLTHFTHNPSKSWSKAIKSKSSILNPKIMRLTY